MELPQLQTFPKPIRFSKRIRHVTVVYNVVNQLPYGEKEDLLADEDTIKTAKEIYQILSLDGFSVQLFELNERTIDDLFELKTDLFFNICYGIGSIPKTEAEVTRVLRKTGIPYTGADDRAILLTTDKVATKKKFLENNIPTPYFQVFASAKDKVDKKFHYPLIIKPINEDCSLGIHNDAVVDTEEELRQRVEFIIKKYKEPVLAEEYIEGRELNITIIGNNGSAKVLPISEIIFGNSYNNGNKWKIVDFEAKWIESSANYQETVGVCPAKLDKDTFANIEKSALTVYNACGCKDYARVDLRLAEDSTPYFLEINLNPGIGQSDGAVRSAKAAGMTYTSFLKQLMKAAVSRY